MKSKGLFRVVSVVIILTSATYGKVISVNPAVPDPTNTYPTIQKAIDAAEEGDEIHIQQGTYAENITLKKSVTLKGEPGQDVIISGDPNSTCRMLCLVEKVQCLIANLRFNPSYEPSAESIVMALNGGNVTIRDCTFDKASVAFSIWGGSRVSIEYSVIQNSTRSGAWISDKQTFVTLNHCKFQNNAESSIHFYRRGSGEISDCTIEGNSGAGVNVSGEGCHVSINDSRFLNNSGVGVLISDKAAGEIQNCEFNSNLHGICADKIPQLSLTGNRSTNNREHGIYLFEVDKSTLNRNVCEANGYNGIYIQHGNRTVLSQNRSLRNKRNGFSFIGASLEIEVSENTATNNEWQGIYVGRQVEGNLIQNELSGNSYNGIYLISSDLSLRENLCQSNAYSGICLTEGSMGPVQKNICRENHMYGIAVWDEFSVPTCEDNVSENNIKGNLFFKEPWFGRVREMMLHGEYDKLDRIAAQMVNEETKNIEGTWQLALFHLHLTNHWRQRSTLNRQKGISAAEKWIEHSPDSQTPAAVLGAICTELGWAARGSGYASTVSPEQWQVFNDYLHKALPRLEESKSDSIKDPELYTRLLVVGRGLGKPKSWMQDVFNQGLSIKKDYYRLHQQMAEYLLPKWHGSSQEARTFADSTIDPENRDRSHIAYALITAGVWGCEPYDDFMRHGFDYNSMKKGFEQILTLYPNSEYHANRLCVFACLYDDKETARKLFPVVKKKTVWSIWKDDQNYLERCKTWAFSEDKPTED